MKLSCTGIKHNNGSVFKSKIFTEGKTYPTIKQTGGFLVKDDLGFNRFIGSSLSFLVSNNDDVMRDIVDHAKAYFEVVTND